MHTNIRVERTGPVEDIVAWETFKRTKKPSPKDPTVTLSKGGQIGLNAAVSRNIVGDAKFAHLLFDKARYLLGIKFMKNNDPDAYPVKLTNNRSHGSLTGVSFLKTYNIYPTETRVFPATYDEQSKILVVDLSSSNPRGTKRRAKL